MGSWNETCMASRLPIFAGDRVAAIPIAYRMPAIDSCYPDGAFVPVCPPLFGEYDDYGNVERVDDAALSFRLLGRCRFLKKGRASYGPLALEDEHGDPPSGGEGLVRAIIDAIRRGNAWLEDSGSLHGTTALPLHLAFVHEDFWTMAMAWAKDIDFVPSPLQDPRRDIVYQSRQVGAMREWLERNYDHFDLRPDISMGPPDGEAILDLMRFQSWMSAMRIAWAPSTGTGGQAGMEPDVLAFHRAVAAMAEGQSHRWD